MIDRADIEHAIQETERAIVAIVIETALAGSRRDELRVHVEALTALRGALANAS